MKTKHEWNTSYNYECSIDSGNERIQVWGDPEYPITLSPWDVVKIISQLDVPIAIDEPEKWEAFINLAKELM